MIFLVLASRMFYTDSERRSFYAAMSQQNRTRITPIAAPRGDILDANGDLWLPPVLPSVSTTGIPTRLRLRRCKLRLAAILGTDMADVEKRVLQYQGRYFEPIPIAKDITPEQYTAIVEDAPNLTGVFIEAEPIRFYPTTSHVTDSRLRWRDSEWQLQDAGIRLRRRISSVSRAGIILRGCAEGKDGYQVEVEYFMILTGQ